MIKTCLQSKTLYCTEFEFKILYKASACASTFLLMPDEDFPSMTTKINNEPIYYPIPHIADYEEIVSNDNLKCGERFFEVYSETSQSFLRVDK